MRKLTSIILLLLVQLSISMPDSFGQMTVTLPDSIAGKGWVKNLIREELKKVGTVPVVPTEPVVKDPCKAGPIIVEISNVSATYLNVKFHGEKVTEFSWTIRDASGTAVRDGKISPQNNTPGVTYNSLPAGAYTLSITGENCRSDVSSKPFTIAGNVGGVTPPVVVPPVTGNVAVITKGLDEHMNLSWTKQGDSYLITDSAAPRIDENYVARYMIGSQIIETGKGQLKNFSIAGFNPVRILKYLVKPHLTLAHWTDKMSEHGNWYDFYAGQGFGYNNSTTYQTVTFPGNTTGWLSPIPAKYNPATQQIQWSEIQEPIKLPAGKVWIGGPLRNWQKTYDLGVTHLPHHNLPWDASDGDKVVRALKYAGKTYSNVQRSEHFLGLQPKGEDNWVDGVNLKYWHNGEPGEQEAINLANRVDISDAIWIGETMEGGSAMNENRAFWGYFYRRLGERYKETFGARGIPYLIAHNYFMFWGENYHIENKTNAKNLFRLRPDQLPQSVFSPGGSLSSTNLIVEGIYLNAPDVSGDVLTKLIFRLSLIKHMGYESGVFLFGVHEWRPNNMLEYTYPDGTYLKQDKIALDPNVNIGASFVSQIFGSLYTEWGSPNEGSKAKTWERNEWNPDLWRPAGSDRIGSGFPHWKSGNDDYYGGYTGSADFSAFGQKLFVDTFGKTVGGTRKFLKYRIDGGAWINPSDFGIDEVIDAFHAKRGFVFSESKDGKTALFYLNSFADNAWHKIEVELPSGQIMTERIAGNGIHAKLL